MIIICFIQLQLIANISFRFNVLSGGAGCLTTGAVAGAMRFPPGSAAESACTATNRWINATSIYKKAEAIIINLDRAELL